MTILRKISIIFLLVFFALTISLWVLAHDFTPEIIHDYVNAKLISVTHQPFKVLGDISWEIFPRPRIKLTKVEVGDDSKPYHLVVSNLFLNLKITPLLRGELVFSEIRGESFNLDLLPQSNAPQATADLSSKTKKSTELSSHFAIERLLLSHGNISFKSKEKTLFLSHVQLGAEQINLKQISFPFQFKSKLEYMKNGKSQTKAFLQFKGSANLATLLTSPDFNIKNSSLNGQLIVTSANIDKLKIDKFQANTSFKANSLELNPLTIDLYHGESLGKLSYNLDNSELNLVQTATGVDSNAIIMDLFEKKIFQGKLDLSIHSKSDLSKDNWLKETSSSGNISIHAGSFEQMSFPELVKATNKRLKDFLSHIQQNLNPLAILTFNTSKVLNGKTPFILLSVQYHLDKAIFSSESFFLETDKLNFKGSGQVSLNDLELKSQFLVEAKSTQEKIGRFQTLIGSGMPFAAKGTLTNPVIGLDLIKIAPLITNIFTGLPGHILGATLSGI